MTFFMSLQVSNETMLSHDTLEKHTAATEVCSGS
jgi:hypothetical protein